MIKNNYNAFLQAVLSALIGIGLIIQPTLNLIGHEFHRHYEVPSYLNFYTINAGIIPIIIGIFLIYLSFYLSTRRQVAYIATITLLVSAFVLMVFMRHRSIALLVLHCGLIVWMLVSYRLYTVKSDLVRLAFGVRISLLIAFIGFIYGVIGFLLLGPRSFHSHFSLQDAAITSFRTLFTFNDIAVPTHQAQVFVYSVNVISVTLFALVIGSLFKPVRFALGPRTRDKKRAREILRASSQSSEDYFKLWPDDKHYYFSPTNDSFLAYKTSGQTAIILGDPCGNPNEFSQLISDFHTFVRSNGWLVGVINATSISESIYSNQKLKKLFIGNEAIITIDDYIAYTSNSKHFRYITNRAKRDGLTTEFWPEVDDEKVRILKTISDAWLSRGGRKEYTFFMGYFTPAYLKACSVIVLKQNDTIVGYINVVPSFLQNEASIDHLRTASNVSPASMHFLLAQLIDHLHTEGKTSLNIGFAPLSGIELLDNKRSTSERLLTILKKFGNRYYSFQGVEQFKGKFQPVWHPRHLFYTAGPTALPRIIRDIERASRLFSEQLRRRRLIASIILFLLIAAFIQFI